MSQTSLVFLVYTVLLTKIKFHIICVQKIQKFILEK